MREHSKLMLWVAQGFGLGRIPALPGTFGSVLGVGWLAVLLLARSWWFFILGALAGVAFSIWICDHAERILKARDPGSVVLDEVVAMPLCFIGWLALAYSGLPGPGVFFPGNWWPIIGVFVLFRLFDIVKPWPVRNSQNLSGGWGVTIDDVLAAGYVNVVVLVIWIIKTPAH
jgi:phosphatidylglycerophosphatase A